VQVGVQQRLLWQTWLPVQALQVPPQPSLVPQAFVPQLGLQHVLLWHTCVSAQVLQVPPQPSLTPQLPGVQVGVQQRLFWQTCPLVQVLQVPPQPSPTWQEPEAQVGVQQALPPIPLLAQVSPGPQPPVHKPPQPSLSPQTLFVQFGTQHMFW
jgi:hypothetical protein